MSDRTPNTPSSGEAPSGPASLASELESALHDAGIGATLLEQTVPGTWKVDIEGTTILIHPYRFPGSRPEPERLPVAFVEVADRVPDWHRAELRLRGDGWLDRRGHLRLWAPRVKLELPFDVGAGEARPRRRHGDVRLEVALWALTHPGAALAIRPVARGIGRSPAQVLAVVSGWIEEGLVDRDRRADLDGLVWALADWWPNSGWIRATDADLTQANANTDIVDVGDDVAARLGAQMGIGLASDAPGHRYVTDVGAWKRLSRLVGGRDAADDTTGVRHRCRPSPTRWLPLVSDATIDADPDSAHSAPPAAHPVVIAARLAADGQRGREIVADWGIGSRLADWALDA